MRVVETLTEIRSTRHELGAGGRTVALVPTMGALHEGHLSLFRLAREQADVLVVSIFVNPLQFGPGEDYAQYPRQRAADLAACRDAGVDAVFLPAVEALYPADRSVTVSAGALGSVFEGRSRPGHFDGVLTVVAKLFHLVQPDLAVFGHKDAQQLACIQRMATDLNMPIRIVGAPIIRDTDGLAVSSRNRYLSPAERSSARALPDALRAAAGEPTGDRALAAAQAVLAREPGVVVDYLALVSPSTFQEVPPGSAGPALLVVAARVGATRLIDNVELTLTGSTMPPAAVSIGG